MSAQPFISSVQVELIGAHEHVRVWVRGQLAGTLIVGPGDGARMRAALGDPSWLVKDFHVLYRTALDAATARSDVAARVHLNAQLDRLRSAFLECDAMRETARVLSIEGAERKAGE